MISVALLLMACHTEVLIAPDPGHAGLQVVAGGDVTDTIEAQPLQALIAEVRGSDGQPAQGLVVRFESLPSADTTRRTDAAVYVCQLTAPTCGQTSTLLTSASLFATDTVDAKGRAKAIVRLGRIPGKAFVRISVPELGLVDTVAYTVLTGAPGGVRGSAADTGLTIGATAVLRGRVVDRYNNPRAELPAMSAGPGVAFTLDPASGTITGTAMGTQYAFFRFGAYVDSTIVRVVPPGRLVVWVPGRGAVRLVDLNGTGVVQTVIASSVTSDLGVYPRFDGTRQRVTLHVGPGPSSTVTVVDTLGTNRRDIGAVFTTIVNERQLSDGTLLVVGRLTTEAAATPFSLWRVGPDNAVTRVAALPGLGTTYNGADISHDGTRVAYVGSPSSLTELRVLNVALPHDDQLRPGRNSCRNQCRREWPPNPWHFRLQPGTRVVSRWRVPDGKGEHGCRAAPHPRERWCGNAAAHPECRRDNRRRLPARLALDGSPAYHDRERVRLRPSGRRTGLRPHHHYRGARGAGCCGDRHH